MSYRNYSVANGFLVSKDGNGDFTTIQSAINAATAPIDIFIRPGTYTENPILVPGVNLVGFMGDNNTPQVIINGNCQYSTTGTVSLNNLELQTNSNFCISLTGSAASTLNVNNCFINCLNSTGISYTTSNASSSLNLINTFGNLATTGIALYSMSSTGNIDIRFSNITNTGLSTLASNNSAGVANISSSQFGIPFSTSSTGIISIASSLVDCTVINTTAITTAGNGSNSITGCYFAGGTASAISIGTGTVFACSDIAVSSTNTNGVTGAGTITYTSIDMGNTSQLMNTSIKTGRNLLVGAISFDGGTNAMSAYTVGTWTPTMIGASTAGTTTYTSQNGYYVRIGSLVQVQAFVQGTAATGTGNVNIAGLPFTIKNQANGQSVGAFAHVNAAGWTWPALTTQLVTNAIANGTLVSVFGNGSGSTAALLQMANAAFAMFPSVTYEI